jgi:hypothetical protein
MTEETIPPPIICFCCGHLPEEIDSIVDSAKEEGLTPDQWIMKEEGTYNPKSRQFCCDRCYIDLGMPTAPHGWKAP